MTSHGDARPTESDLRRVRWHLGAVGVLVAVVLAGSVLAASSDVNTGDGQLIAVLITVSAVTLVRLARAMVAVRFRPIVPLAFLWGLLANIAMFASFLRYAVGGETDSAALFLPISLAHLLTVIAYGVMANVAYRQQAPNATTGTLLFSIAYVGILLTFIHVLFV